MSSRGTWSNVTNRIRCGGTLAALVFGLVSSATVATAQSPPIGPPANVTNAGDLVGPAGGDAAGLHVRQARRHRERGAATQQPRDSAFEVGARAQYYAPGPHQLVIPKWYWMPPDAFSRKPQLVSVPAYQLDYTVRYIDPRLLTALP